jgi:hypothetical protein
VPTGRRGDPSHMRRVNFGELRNDELRRISIPRTRVNKGKYWPGGGNASRTARNTSGPFFVRALWEVAAPEQSRRRAYASFADAIAMYHIRAGRTP